jgi:hypothetical protein
LVGLSAGFAGAAPGGTGIAALAGGTSGVEARSILNRNAVRLNMQPE